MTDHEATEADIGRRVIYSHPALKHKGRGVITGLDGRWVAVQFDGDDGRAGPLKCGASMLTWADKGPTSLSDPNQEEAA